MSGSRTVTVVPEPGVEKWGGDDAGQTGTGARVDTVKVEIKERQKIEDLEICVRYTRDLLARL